MSTDITWLTQDAHDRLQSELTERSGPRRSEITKRIEAAREEGDLKENGDYHAAKDEHGHMEGRIRQLESILENVEIVEPPVDGSVGFGTIVTVLYDGDDPSMAESYLIGHIEERCESAEVMSPTSPLGAALLGVKKGDMVTYAAPNGNLKVKIIGIQQQ